MDAGGVSGASNIDRTRVWSCRVAFGVVSLGVAKRKTLSFLLWLTPFVDRLAAVDSSSVAAITGLTEFYRANLSYFKRCDSQT